MSVEAARRPRGSSTVTGRFVLLPWLALCVATDVAAQEQGARGQSATTDDNSHRITTVSPSAASPGSFVRVESRLLPAITPVLISLGGTRSGFEVLAQVMTDRRGRLSETVTIPAWATPDRTHVFRVLDMYFDPLAESDVFHVTDPDGIVVRQGRVAGDSTSCLTLRGEDGELYPLGGMTGRLRHGDRVIVEAAIAPSPGCADGTALDVIAVRMR